ncbi:MAG: HAD family phosphatase [Bacteroidota bacterium]
MNKKNSKSFIKNIIFDFGGVIIPLHPELLRMKLMEFKSDKTDPLEFEIAFNEQVEKFEAGQISEELFLNFIIKHCHYKIQALDVINAWNSLLGKIDVSILRAIESLKSKYTLFALSNNNALHVQHLNKVNLRLEEEGHEFFSLFKHIYYSHLIQLSKPKTEAFEFAINDAGILASETLFIDDRIENIEAALSLGFFAFHLKDMEDLIPFISSL